MRAPPDSMKPTTRHAGAAGQAHDADDRLGVLLAQRAAEVRRVLGVAEDRPAVDAPGAGDDAVTGTRLVAHALGHDVRAQERERALVAERLQPLDRREPALLGDLGDLRGLLGGLVDLGEDVVSATGAMLMRGLQAQHGVVAAEPERVGQRDRQVAVDIQRASRVRHVIEVEALVGLLVAQRGRRDPVAQGEDGRDGLDGAGGAEQVPDRRLGRGHGDLPRAVAERQLDRLRLRAVVERRRGAVGVDVVDVGGRDAGALQRLRRSPARRRGPRAPAP